MSYIRPVTVHRVTVSSLLVCVVCTQGLLENNNARLDRQDEQMFATGRAVQALVAQVSELTTQLQQLRMPAAPLPPPVSPAPLNSATQREPRLPDPEGDIFYGVAYQLGWTD